MAEEPGPNQPLDLGFVKELYVSELENKHKLDSRMATLVVILSAIAGLLLYSVHAFTPGALWFNVVSVASMVVSAVLFFFAFAFLIRGTLGYDYGRIASMKEIEETFNRLQEHHRSHPDQPGTPQSGLDETLVTRMLQATDRNRDCNLTRGARYYTAMLLMAWAVGSGLVAGSVVTVAEKLHEIKGKGEQMANEDKPAAEAPKATDQPAQPAADSGTAQPVEKPVLPENTLFKGNDVPLSTRVITGEKTKQSGDK
jgi:hypothetical protein